MSSRRLNKDNDELNETSLKEHILDNNPYRSDVFENKQKCIFKIDRQPFRKNKELVFPIPPNIQHARIVQVAHESNI